MLLIQKYSFLILAFLSITQFSKSQIQNFDNVELLLGKSKSEIITYFEKLNKMSKNPFYKIKTEYNGDAQEVISVEYAITEEKYYKCLANTVILDSKSKVFQQSFFFSNESASANLNYLKSKFSFLKSTNEKDESNWEYKINEEYFIHGIFKKIDDDLYILTYYFDKS